jgi:hypothetical protein
LAWTGGATSAGVAGGAATAGDGVNAVGKAPDGGAVILGKFAWPKVETGPKRCPTKIPNKNNKVNNANRLRTAKIKSRGVMLNR